jgi:hypothetical protein
MNNIARYSKTFMKEKFFPGEVATPATPATPAKF